MLVRPAALGVPLVLAFVVCIVKSHLGWRTRLAMAAALMAGSLVVVLPWEAWVFMRTGQVIPVSTNGTWSIRDGLTFAANREEGRVGAVVPPRALEVMRQLHARHDELESFNGIATELTRQVQQRPEAVAELFAFKVARSWYGTDSERFEAPILLLQILYVAGLIYCTARAWRMNGVFRRLAIAVWCLTLYFWGMTVLVLSILRYMTPVIGLLFVLVPALAPTHRWTTTPERV